MKRAALLVAPLLVLAVGACGGSKPPPETPVEENNHPPPRHGGGGGHKRGPSVSQELGEIDPQEANRAFQRIQGKLMACQKEGMAKVEPLAGDIKVFVRIGADGHARYAYFEETTLGDVETEKCMLEAILHAPWPQPRGGEAETRTSFGFESGDARAPSPWGAEKVQSALTKSDADLKKCTSGLTGTVKVTAYVEPDGKEGKVLAVGVATPNKEAAAKVDCIVDAVKAMKLPSPGSYLAKVTFQL
jgi:hypothetical protein